MRKTPRENRDISVRAVYGRVFPQNSKSLQLGLLFVFVNATVRAAGVVCGVDTHTYTGDRSFEILLFLRLYEPYHRLLRLFRFNDPHPDSEGGSSSSPKLWIVSLQPPFPPFSPFAVVLSFSFWFSLPFSLRSPFPLVWKLPRRMRKLKPLGSAIKFDNRSVFEAFLHSRRIYESAAFRRKS